MMSLQVEMMCLLGLCLLLLQWQVVHPWLLQSYPLPATVSAVTARVSCTPASCLSVGKVKRQDLRLFEHRPTTTDVAAGVVAGVVPGVVGVGEEEEDWIDIPSNGVIDYLGKHVQNQLTTVAPADKVAAVDVTLDEIVAKSFYDLFHSSTVLPFRPPSKLQRLRTKWNLWCQFPWQKLPDRRTILAVKIAGSYPLEASNSLFQRANQGNVDNLKDIMNMFMYAAYDPRVVGIVVEFGELNVGLAKCKEILRAMQFYQQSGKKVIGYFDAISMSSYYVASQCDELYMPPEGILDLRGFASESAFYRDLFDKVGIEPQVRRLGKYKSFADMYSRANMTDAQREVLSSLINERLESWIQHVAQTKNQSINQVRKLFVEDANRSPYDFKDKGLISGVMYRDQFEDLLRHDRFAIPYNPSIPTRIATRIGKSLNSIIKWFKKDKRVKKKQTMLPLTTDYSLEQDFLSHPRRRVNALWEDLHQQNQTASTPTNESVKEDVGKTTEEIEVIESNVKITSHHRSNIPNNNDNEEEEEFIEMSKVKPNMLALKFFPADIYMSKMTSASKIFPSFPIKETKSGPRIGIIQLEGAIVGGKSGGGLFGGGNIGSDTVIEMIRKVKKNPAIQAVVLRIDSPGGSALASDLVWGELRSLSKVKPVVASMVDVAASGGYYFAMGCDEIVADDDTITGSIGVVITTFQRGELNRKFGINTESVSIGKYAELMTTSRPFKQHEEECFDEFAQKAYKSFVTRAAASRSMSVDALEEVAQGRVWTGRQARERGLVDHEGGLHKALTVAVALSKEDVILKWREFLHNFHTNQTEGSRPTHLALESVNVEYIQPKSASGLAKIFGSGASSSSSSNVLTLACDEVFQSGLVGDASFGIQGSVLKDLGVNAQTICILKTMGVLEGLETASEKLTATSDIKTWLINTIVKTYGNQ